MDQSAPQTIASKRASRTGMTPWAPNTFLGSLPPATATELVEASVPRYFAPGRVLIREGASEMHVELLLSGFVKVSTVVEDLTLLLSIRPSGELVGETGALTGQPRNATVTASGPVLAGVLSRSEFAAAQHRYPELASGLHASAAAQLSWANRRRTEYGVYPAQVRIARVLGEIAGVCGRPIGACGVQICVPLSQSELAGMVSIGRATAQKAIHELRSRQLITTGYRRLTIVDPAALRKVAEGRATEPPTESAGIPYL